MVFSACKSISKSFVSVSYPLPLLVAIIMFWEMLEYLFHFHPTEELNQ